MRGIPLAIIITFRSRRSAGARSRWRLRPWLRRSISPYGDERNRLTHGAPATKLIDADESKEVAVFGAVWINAPIRRYVESVRDIENFERGGAFKVTRRISVPPRIEDFAALHLSDEDLGDLPRCRVGDCEVKLGELQMTKQMLEGSRQAAAVRTRPFSP